MQYPGMKAVRAAFIRVKQNPSCRRLTPGQLPEPLEGGEGFSAGSGALKRRARFSGTSSVVFSSK